jgi:uncharacterized protein YndB with AHSA1/START domain
MNARAHVASDRTWQLPAAPDDVWAALADTAAYRRWWPWLRRFEATALAAGDVWGCTVQPPLPYSLSFTVDLRTVTPPAIVVADLSGDLSGPARIELARSGSGSTLRLVSDLRSHRGGLAAVAGLVGPVARWGHDRLLSVGVRQFTERALV